MLHLSADLNTVFLSTDMISIPKEPSESAKLSIVKRPTLLTPNRPLCSFQSRITTAGSSKLTQTRIRHPTAGSRLNSSYPTDTRYGIASSKVLRLSLRVMTTSLKMRPHSLLRMNPTSTTLLPKLTVTDSISMPTLHSLMSTTVRLNSIQRLPTESAAISAASSSRA